MYTMSQKGILLRRYLCKRLSDYYSQPANAVVGSIESASFTRWTIDFSSLINEWHWKRTYKKVYQEQKGMWLTPVELFFPYYSNILANFVGISMSSTTKKMHNDEEGLFDIVELGGGRGTNAVALLDHLRAFHPKVYDRLQSYTIFDTSPTLHKLQKDILLGNGSSHPDKVKLVNVDMMDIVEGKSEFLTPSDIPTAVIALELLDNLPHDKIARCMVTGDILQAEVVPTLDDGKDDIAGYDINTEKFSPMIDPHLTLILSIAPTLYTPTVGPRWVPTVALGIIIKIYECRPNSSVAFADFDWLPPPDLRGSNLSIVEAAVGDPIVTDMGGIDHPCYLTEPTGLLCDILFPTDFDRLSDFTNQYLTKEVGKQLRNDNTMTTRFDLAANAMKQRDFLLKYGYGEVQKTKAWSNYSPLTDDFGNCSVLTITPK